MKIHFCELCNESVPQADLDAGHAFMRKGRVICATCDRLMTAEEAQARGRPVVGATPSLANPAAGAVSPAGAGAAAASGGLAMSVAAHEPRAARSGGGGGGVWLAAVTLVFAVVAIALIVERTSRLEAELGGLEGALSGLERRTEARVAAQASALESRAREGEERINARLVEELARLERGFERLDARIEDASHRREADLAALESVRKDLGTFRGDHSERLQALVDRLARGEQDIAFHGKRLTDIEMAQLVRKAPLREEGSEPAPAWRQSLPDLSSPVAGTRWQAVDTLGRSGDPAVVEHLVPLLKDADTFVRMATARVLGELGSREGVEPLFDALEDQEAAVREAAWVSLVALTGRDFRYDPLGNESERQKRLKTWREWWRKEGSKEPEAASVAGSSRG